MSWVYPRKKKPSLSGGIRLHKATRAGDTWWSTQWMKAVSAFTKAPRLARGHKAALMGQVSGVRIDQGFAEALVQGTRLQPYKVEIGLPMFSQRQWKRAADALMKQAYPVAKLLAGELPHEVAELFAESGAPLFPMDEADLSTDCSCIDEHTRCPHVAAVFYILGQEFDRDPFLLLEMRGLTRPQLLAEIQLRRANPTRTLPKTADPQALSTPPHTTFDSHLNDFFNAPNGQSLKWDRPANYLEQVPPAGGRIKELGAPPFWQSDHDFEGVLKGIYLAVRRRVLGQN